MSTHDELYTPRTSPDNPGQATRFRVNLTRDQEAWDEDIDLSAMLKSVLDEAGIETVRGDAWLRTSHGFWLLPQIASLEIAEEGTARTSTTIQIAHETLVPQGCFEYQHATSRADVATSLMQGLSQWARTDAVVLHDSAREALEDCGAITIAYPAADADDSGRRRVVFGPTSHYVEHPDAEVDDAHPFCPCCLFTNSIDAFNTLLKAGEFAAIRLYAARDSDGGVSADCRVNGVDFEPGAEALRAYVQTWPARGLEFRKQLVVAQRIDGAA
ncbi:MAG: DUF6348 family protein [Bordetella sp.]|nr:DUF6348 family protein [Bordetella sp.]